MKAFRQEWEALLSAFCFFTRLPLCPRIFRLERGVLYLPLVGAFLGSLIFFFLHYLGQGLPPPLKAFGALLLVYFLADYFHFDGLLDTIDAWAASGTREQRLKILKSPEVGALGVLWAFFFLLGEFLLAWELLASGHERALFLRPLCGREALALMALLGKPAKEGGLGSLFLASSRKRLWLTQILWVVLFYYAPLPSLGVVILVLGLRAKFHKDFGGLTGDLLGATLMLAQWTFLALELLVGVRFSPW